MAFRIDFLFFGALVVFSILYISLYAKLPSNTTLNPMDNRESFRVKVLPADLDDVSLNSLPKESFSYLAMIDAGSSGCRAHVYKYGRLGSTSGPVYILPQHVSKKVKPALSTFGSHPEDAGASLKELIDFLKLEVPDADWSVTPIWLIATAGMRMLPPHQSDAVMTDVRRYLSNSDLSPFLFRSSSWARIISGNEEGGFGWIAYNYLRKIIGPKKDSSTDIAPYAVVEMGGASAQVSQLAPNKEEADKIPSEYRFSFTIEKETFHLYTHSYLGYGAEEGREQLNKLLTTTSDYAVGGEIQDPCLNRGYFRAGTVERTLPYEGPVGAQWNTSGASDTAEDQCVRQVRRIFTGTSGVACGQPGSAVFDCVYQPSFVKESRNMLLFENFYYMTSAIGVKAHTASKEELKRTGPNAYPLETTPANMLHESQHYCSLPYDTLRPTYPLDKQPTDVITKMCFVSSFAYNFLTSGLKLPEDKIVTIQNEVGENEIEIALGAAYKEISDLLLTSEWRTDSEI